MPAYYKNFQIIVYGPPARDKSLKDLFKFQMNSEYFPVPLGDLNAQIVMQEVREPFRLDDLQITSFYMNHPAMTLAFKIFDGEKTFVFATDNEPYRYTLHAARKDPLAAQYGAELDQKFVDFITGADVVVCDAQYTQEEYRSKIGWGHSPIESVVEFAIKAHVKQLALFHHDPSHDDAAIDAIVLHAQRLISLQKSSVQCFGAAEGMEIKLV
jgi:phosphoribosyl 1,2-cyclic phosphodiesterase